jgi:hypothetical protein
MEMQFEVNVPNASVLQYEVNVPSISFVKDRCLNDHRVKCIIHNGKVGW